MDVEPRLSGFEAVAVCVARRQPAHRDTGVAADAVEDLPAPGVDRDPVGGRGIHGVGHVALVEDVKIGEMQRCPGV